MDGRGAGCFTNRHLALVDNHIIFAGEAPLPTVGFQAGQVDAQCVTEGSRIIDLKIHL